MTPSRRVRRAAGPLLPEVRPRGRGLGRAGSAADRASGHERARALRLGYVTGAVSALGLLYWTSYVVVQFGGLSLPVGIAVMVLLCLAFAVFPALFAWVVARWVAAVGRRGPAARSLRLGGDRDPARQHLLLLSLVPARLQPGGQPADRSDRAPWRRLRGLVPRGPGVVGAGLHRRRAGRRAPTPGGRRPCARSWPRSRRDGLWRSRAPLPETGRVRVGLVQASILQEEKWDEALAFGNLERHVELTRAGRRRRGAPGRVARVRGAVLLRRHARRRPDLNELAGRLRVPLLFGNDDREPGDERAQLRGREADRSGRRLLLSLPQDPAGAVRRVRAAAAAPDPRRARGRQARPAGRRLLAGRKLRARRGRRPQALDHDLLRGDLPRPGPRVRRRAARSCS